MHARILSVVVFLPELSTGTIEVLLGSTVFWANKIHSMFSAPVHGQYAGDLLVNYRGCRQLYRGYQPDIISYGRSDSDEGGRVGGDLIYVRDGRRIRAAGQAQAFMMGVRFMRTRTVSTAV